MSPDLHDLATLDTAKEGGTRQSEAEAADWKWLDLPTAKAAGSPPPQKAYTFPDTIVRIDAKSTEKLAKMRSERSEISPEKYGWTMGHCVFNENEQDTLEVVNQLGNGSIGYVEEVRRLGTSFPTLVRKRIIVPRHKKRAETIIEIIRDEIATLTRLRHPHIVALIRSYEDRRNPKHGSYCLLMVPVGDGDLESFLAEAGEELDPRVKKRNQTWIRSWYADLASALGYMHEHGVRHQDIKPSNIIHKDDRIYFTDFSSCGEFRVGQTTSTANPARSTAMYAAPEASLEKNGRYGRAFDLFALGCVFCEMIAVECGHTVPALHDFLLENAEEESRLRYSEHLPSLERWLESINIDALERSFIDLKAFLKLVFDMLLEDRHSRPSAAEVLIGCLAR